MADPFEVRMRFTAQLQHLNASVTSSQKAAHYALKYREMDEDLHSCILEQLERNSMNNRANIMYFIEHFCDLSQREGHINFVRMMQRDIAKVVDAVAPEDGSGAANVKVVRRVLQGLKSKGLLPAAVHVEIEEVLKERDTKIPEAGSPAIITTDAMMPLGVGSYNFAKLPPNGITRLDKRQIEQRIEEDRERHKRLRESYWTVAQDSEPEYDRMMRETSPVAEDDWLYAQEEADERSRVIATF